MKKLFAVATFVAAASGTAMAIRAADESVPDRASRASSEPGAAVEQIVTADDITPLVLRSGSPACGNVTHKGDVGRRRCPTVTGTTMGIVAK